MKIQRMSLLVMILLVGLALTFIIVTHKPVSLAEEENKAKPVKVISLSPAPFVKSVEFSGFVRGARQADIAPKTAGYLVRVEKEEGDLVKVGETLAIIDGSELTSAKEATLLSLQSMEKVLRESERYYEKKVDEAEVALDNASGSAEREAAASALSSAKRLRDAQLATLRMQYTALEGSLFVNNTHLKNTVIRAPFSGIVTKRHANLGAFAPIGISLYTIASPESFEISVALPVSLLPSLAKGKAVTIVKGETVLPGVIASLSGGATESSQQAIARIRPEGRTALTLGEHVKVRFSLASEREALLVPERALIHHYDDTFVYVVEDGVAQKKKVVVGGQSDGLREIISGLSPSAKVIIEGFHGLSANDRVTEVYE